MAIALNIPSQIEKYLSVALFPATGNEFTLYIANDTNRLYQWNGAAYIEVSQQDAVNWGSIGGDIINQTDLQLALAGKVDVEAGKGLSTNDYTTAEKNKLAGIEAGAQVNDVDSVNGYTGSVVLSKSDVGLSNVDNTSDANKPISTATQTALNAKQNTLSLTTTGDNGASTLVGSTLNVPNYTLSGLGGVPTSRTLTINGVTQDLSANRTFTISTGITIGSTAIASGVVGRVLFEGAGNVVQESSSLFWDNTNSNLGVGIGSPAARLDVITSANKYALRLGENTANGDGSWTGIKFQLSTNTSNLDTQNGAMNIVAYRYSAGSQLSILNSTTTIATFGSASNSLLIGTTTDAGFKLDVNGTARVSGVLYFTNGNTQIFQNANDLYFAVGSGINRLVIKSTGNLLIGTTTDVASSLVTMESTTKGFLPPRMTTTQKNAIATPATGLVVYDTTLNKLCVYTTAWETVTSL